MSATICWIFFTRTQKQVWDCKLNGTIIDFHFTQLTYHNISLQKLGRVYSNADSALIFWPCATSQERKEKYCLKKLKKPQSNKKQSCHLPKEKKKEKILHNPAIMRIKTWIQTKKKNAYNLLYSRCENWLHSLV